MKPVGIMVTCGKKAGWVLINPVTGGQEPYGFVHGDTVEDLYALWDAVAVDIAFTVTQKEWDELAIEAFGLAAVSAPPAPEAKPVKPAAGKK